MKHRFLPGVLGMFAILVASAPTHAEAKSCGNAAWYQYTTRTASGEMANPNAMTAAHRTLPFGTRVKVTNLRNGRSVTVRINDRGPYTKGRVIDVTRAAALKLGFKNAGWTPVALALVDGPAGASSTGCPR